MRILFFLEDVDIEKVIVITKISFGEKTYKCFTSYLYNDYKNNSCYDRQTKWINYFYLR